MLLGMLMLKFFCFLSLMKSEGCDPLLDFLLVIDQCISLLLIQISFQTDYDLFFSSWCSPIFNCMCRGWCAEATMVLWCYSWHGLWHLRSFLACLAQLLFYFYTKISAIKNLFVVSSCSSISVSVGQKVGIAGGGNKGCWCLGSCFR